MRQQAMVIITHKLLEDLLQLPKGNRVTRVIQELSDERMGRCLLIVEGPLMPEVCEGEMFREILPETHNGKIVWKQS